MVDGAVQLLKITVRTSWLVGVVMAFIVVFNIMITGLLIGLNLGVLTDVFAIINMWMPFNLGVVITWLMTVSLLFLGYRALMVGFGYLNRVLG